ncbi:MAG TPA: hypothetical protein VGB92_03805 [Longimicrobium sp.]
MTSPNGDTAVPVLKGFSITPSTINVAAASATVRFTFAVSDAGSGINYVGVTTPLAGGGLAGLCTSSTPESGTSNDGTYGCTITVPRGHPAGTYTVTSVLMQDKVGNRFERTGAQLAAAGHPTAISVENSASDTSPPVLKGFSFTPSTINVTTASATVRFTFAVSDAGSGINSVAVTTPLAGGGLAGLCTSSTPESGTSNDGTYSCTITVPRGAASGTYPVSAVILRDKVGNSKEYTTEQLQAAGYATMINVTN